jgi:ribose transport system ATP-binding protein
MASPPVLRMAEITKTFPGTLALDGVDLEVERGSIDGLVGQNGAGKSTLLKILAGDYRPTSGRIEIDGEEIEIDSPRRAHELGIGIVYQELSLLPNLSVAHNISLGSERVRGVAIDEPAVRADAASALARMGIDHIDLERKVGDLSLSERQLVEVAKVLTLRRPRILIFDEPTAALAHGDVERLFRILRGLRDEGAAIIFVSHRYREVLEICDRSTVLRNGRVVGRLGRTEATLERLVELTLGQKAEAAFSRRWRSEQPGEVVLETRGLAVGSRVAGVDLVVRRGEIVGLCGLLGSGQNQLARALVGDAADVSGSMTLLGRNALPRNPREAVRRGAGFISESRQEEGLFPEMTVRSNISVAALDRLLWSRLVRVVRRRRERRLTSAAAAQTGIAPRVLQRPIRVLSGGNQQKSLLSRWLVRRSDLLVTIEPTRGVDVGAKVDIYRELEDLARGGAALVIVSTDIPEILGLSDRIVVFYRGRVTAVLDPQTVGEQDVLLAMQGGTAAGPSRLLQEVG